MSLASNTQSMLAPIGREGERTAIRVEYHMLSWRELYDKSIITADRYSSGAGEWVIRPGKPPYSVRVVSRPFYHLPQELCLAFDCHEVRTESNVQGLSSLSVRTPHHEVASQFLVLLSVFAREPLFPLGLRRMDDRPIAQDPPKRFSSRDERQGKSLPFGIDSPKFLSVIAGLAQAEQGIADAVLASANFYHAGLSLVAQDPSVAYVSLVSAVECLAGFYGEGHIFEFDDVPKFERLKPVLGRLTEASRDPQIVEELKAELLRSEHFLRKKFVQFLADHVTDEFWQFPDELFKYDDVFPRIERGNFEACLKEIYDARSTYLHGGVPFPGHVGFGLVPVDLPMTEPLHLCEKPRYVPLLAWFERLCHVALVRFYIRQLSPNLAEAAAQERLTKERLLGRLAELPASVQGSLRGLVKQTARFLGAALINPHFPNGEWADSAETVRTLRAEGLIGGEGDELTGSSWLANRVVGEIVGEFVFGAAKNPFRGNEMLLPEGWK